MSKEALRFEQPEPCGWKGTSIQQIASELAGIMGYSPGADIEAIVRAQGGSIQLDDVASVAHTGSIEVRGRGDFTIHLSPYTGYLRSRFTIAHELGHYFLHSLAGEKRIRARRHGSDQLEWEANWFAAGFLMPEAIFREKVTAGWQDIRIAGFFDVSRKAVEVRRNSLGL